MNRKLLVIYTICLFCSGCFESDIDKVDRLINNTISRLEDGATNVGAELASLKKQIPKELDRLTKQIDDISQRAIAAAGSESLCVVDNVRESVKVDLQGILRALKSDTKEYRVPRLCTAHPTAIDLDAPPDEIQWSGYNLDLNGFKLVVEEGDQAIRPIDEKHFSHPAHYILKIRVDDLGLKDDDKKIIIDHANFPAGSRRYSLNIIPRDPVPVDPIYFRGDMIRGIKAGNNEFYDPELPSRIEAIRVFHGDYLDAIQIKKSGKWQKKHGGSGGKQTEIPFGSSEKITKIKIWNGHWLNAIQIITNRSSYGPYGDDHGRVDEITVSPKRELAGFYGIQGSYLDALGAIFKE